MRLNTRKLGVVLSMASLAAPLGAAPPAPPAPQQGIINQQAAAEDGEARVELAERFFDLGMSLARGKALSRPTLRQRAVFLQASTVLNPLEPRYYRYVARTFKELGDSDSAMGAWKDYLRHVPDDHVAQIELIDGYLQTLESNDAKLAHLNRLLANPGLHDQVKAHLAAEAVPLLDQRSHEQAVAMLARARKFYPLPEVTLLEWQMLPADATVEQRFEALLNVLRANPVEPEAIARVADILSAAGMSEPALVWYAMLVDVHAANGTGPSKDSIVNYLAERYHAGETTVAAEQLDAILQKFPEDADAWFLRLTIQRADESEQMLRQAQASFIKRLSNACDQALKQAAPAATEPAAAPDASGSTAKGPDTAPGAVTPPAATQPAATQPTTAPATQFSFTAEDTPATMPARPGPDISNIPLDAAIAKAMQSDDPQDKNSLFAALADLAWFEAYFDHRADLAVPWLAAMKKLAPADNTTLLRLSGWTAFVAGDDASARPIFTAQQDSDPLSALGLYRLEDKEKNIREAEIIGRKILSRPHTGVMGAILWQATKGHGLRPNGPPPEANALQKLLDGYPKEFLEVVRTPAKVYSIRAEPLKIGHRLGEAFLANVTIQNISTADITIGRYGLVKPRMVFDVSIRGMDAKIYPGIAEDQIMGRIVLSKDQSVTQIVRVDQGVLSDTLRNRPALTMNVIADTVSNARTVDGKPQAQAGGFAQNFTRFFVRDAEPLAQDRARRKFFDRMNKGSPGEKMYDLDLLASYVRQDVRQNASDKEKADALQFTDVIDKSRGDTAPGIKIWASFCESTLFADAEAKKLLEEMIASNSWESRLIALYSSQTLAANVQKELATKLENDADPLVKAYAKAALDQLAAAAAAAAAGPPAPAEPAATAPATMPATAPDAAPAASQPAATLPAH